MRRIIFLLISIIFLVICALQPIIRGEFTFAFDMGRDMLWTRNMVELKKPTLIGPWGSIAGVYFGPLWYYLLAVPYVISGGDPRASVLVPLIGNVLAMVLGWWLLNREGHKVAANMWAVLFAISPLILSISSFPFHANLLPFAMMLLIVGLYKCSIGDLKVGLSLAAFSSSVSYHLEPASGVMTTLFALLWIGWFLLKQKKKDWKKLLSAIVVAGVVFAIPFVPQMIFELRHDFIQTKSLLAYFSGENTSLGGVLPLPVRITERVTKIADTLARSAVPIQEAGQKLAILFAFLSATVVCAKREIHRFSGFICSTALAFLLFHYAMYAFFFPAELKGWYLYGFVVIFLLPISLFLERAWSIREIRVFLIVLVSITALQYWNGRRKAIAVPAPETLSAQSQVVTWIYNDAKTKNTPFSVYTYTPPIYDYSYQYLLWWQGRKLGVLPAEFGYLPNETSYLPEKQRFVSAAWSPQDAKIIYLILEPDEFAQRKNGWLGHFATYPLLEQKQFSSGVDVEIREKQ